MLVQAFPDTAGKMTIADRRDSFCGKMSACNNMRQYGLAVSMYASDYSGWFPPFGAGDGSDASTDFNSITRRPM